MASKEGQRSDFVFYFERLPWLCSGEEWWANRVMVSFFPRDVHSFHYYGIKSMGQ